MIGYRYFTSAERKPTSVRRPRSARDVELVPVRRVGVEARTGVQPRRRHRDPVERRLGLEHEQVGADVAGPLERTDRVAEVVEHSQEQHDVERAAETVPVDLHRVDRHVSDPRLEIELGTGELERFLAPPITARPGERVRGEHAGGASDVTERRTGTAGVLLVSLASLQRSAMRLLSAGVRSSVARTATVMVIFPPEPLRSPRQRGVASAMSRAEFRRSRDRRRYSRAVAWSPLRQIEHVPTTPTLTRPAGLRDRDSTARRGRIRRCNGAQVARVEHAAGRVFAVPAGRAGAATTRGLPGRLRVRFGGAARRLGDVGCFDAVGDAELAQDVGNVNAGGLRADEQFGCDLAVGPAAREQI